MKKTIVSMFETGVLHLVVLCLFFAVALCLSGCTATKIEYEKNADGVTKYSIWHNDHWLKRDTGAMSGGMGEDGKFEVKLENAIASPSEEFNRTMQTYTSAIVSMMQIAAAAYNPSSSAAASGKESTTVNVQMPSTTEAKTSANASSTQASASTAEAKASDPHAADCPSGTCTDSESAGGSLAGRAIDAHAARSQAAAGCDGCSEAATEAK